MESLSNLSSLLGLGRAGYQPGANPPMRFPVGDPRTMGPYGGFNPMQPGLGNPIATPGRWPVGNPPMAGPVPMPGNPPMHFPIGNPPMRAWGGQPPMNGPFATSPAGGPIQPVWGGQPATSGAMPFQGQAPFQGAENPSQINLGAIGGQPSQDMMNFLRNYSQMRRPQTGAY